MEIEEEEHTYPTPGIFNRHRRYSTLTPGQTTALTTSRQSLISGLSVISNFSSLESSNTNDYVLNVESV